MAETTDAPVEQTVEQPVPSPFSNQAWTETVEEPKPTPETNGAPPAAEATPPATPEVKAEPAVEEEIIEPKEWLKREFGTDDAALLKQEREDYKKLKESAPQEVKFADEQSKNLYELIREGKKKEVKEFLELHEQIDALSGAEVTQATAEDIIKFGMKLRNGNLSKDEINFLYKQDYTAPKEPVQRATEDEDDFKERHDEWKQRVSDLEMKRTVAAKLAQPELAKSKSQIVLPELSKPQAPNVPSQESLAAHEEALKKIRDNFLQRLESDYSKVEGFSAKVKDELVEIPVAFKIPDEDKAAIKARLTEGFDVNELIDKRWFDANGNPRIEQTVYDLYVLENLDKVLSGIANNAAAKRLTEYQKSTKNVQLNNGTNSQPTFQPQNPAASRSPYDKGAWVETPPSSNN